ncbi:lysosomal alpha-glucosidase-like [Saccoglossus kowalevskii]|uniref:Lysosomal alpha-glucosidase-like n=1 Tax=Saccoglossus kowalevskii TaxID=10224 RepID=A0ABM0LU12_SACKO|nr:PREDICTED: lysosomal alpha-glucosidase-like [Saccoglossus kowalevskii]
MSPNFNLLRTCLVLVVLLLLQSTATSALQCIIEDSLRFDCYPESGATKDACQARGCCWRQPNLALEQKKYFKDKLATNSVPTCFYPKDFPSYSITSLTETDFGYTAHLSRTTKTYYPKDLLKLKMDVILETDTRLHFKIYDPDNDRYEVPIDTPAFTNKSYFTILLCGIWTSTIQLWCKEK